MCWLLREVQLCLPLLEDGANRFLQLGALEAEIIGRIELCQANFLEVAETLESTQVVYLDPMFPTKNKIAKAKKRDVLLAGADRFHRLTIKYYWKRLTRWQQKELL